VPATLAELEGNLMLFFTGSQRDAGALLSHQVAAIETDEVQSLVFRGQRRANQGIPLALKTRRLTGSDTALVKSSCIALFVIRGVHVWRSSEDSST